MLKKGRNTFAYPSFFLNLCYKTYFFSWIICKFLNCPYLCNVFFIVLDLRLTKVGVQRYSFFYARTFQHPCFPFASLHFHMPEMKIPEY